MTFTNTFMLVLAFSIPLLFWGIALLIFPRTIWKKNWPSNASNTAYRITMRHGITNPAAVWAQEYYEARYKLTRPWFAFWLVLSKAFGLHKAQRKLELMGHAVELAAVRIVYGLPNGPYNAYLWREISAMRDGYVAFQGMKASQIKRLLDAHEKQAEAFVRRHVKKIRQHQ